MSVFYEEISLNNENKDWKKVEDDILLKIAIRLFEEFKKLTKENQDKFPVFDPRKIKIIDHDNFEFETEFIKKDQRRETPLRISSAPM